MVRQVNAYPAPRAGGPVRARPRSRGAADHPAETVHLINGAGGEIGVFVVADNGGVPVAGTYSLQPIEVCQTSVGAVTVGGLFEEDVPTGRLLIIRASGGSRFGVRFVGFNLGAATRARVFWWRIN